MNALSTIEKVEAASDGKPEYVDSKGLRAVYGLSRSLGYALINEGKVKSVCLRKRGASRGKRLWVADSVREYLNSCIDQPAAQPELAPDIKNNESPNSSKRVLASDKKTGSPKPWIGMSKHSSPRGSYLLHARARSEKD